MTILIINRPDYRVIRARGSASGRWPEVVVPLNFLLYLNTISLVLLPNVVPLDRSQNPIVVKSPGYSSRAVAGYISFSRGRERLNAVFDFFILGIVIVFIGRLQK